VGWVVDPSPGELEKKKNLPINFFAAISTNWEWGFPISVVRIHSPSPNKIEEIRNYRANETM